MENLNYLVTPARQSPGAAHTGVNDDDASVNDVGRTLAGLGSIRDVRVPFHAGAAAKYQDSGCPTAWRTCVLCRSSD
jgi:hypothetical protein